MAAADKISMPSPVKQSLPSTPFSLAKFDFATKSVNRKAQHAMDMLSSIEGMWKETLACDFTIKVGNRDFFVHKTLLIAFSDYFKAMFGTCMVESFQGFVEMKEVEESAIERCIQFIYTGETGLTSSNVSDVLNASTMLQLEKMKDACYEYLTVNLACKNCISTLELARLYNNKDLITKAEEYFSRNFVSVAKCVEFLGLEKDDALVHILEFGSNDDAKWEASLAWIGYVSECREEEVLDFFNMLDLVEFPSVYLLKNTWDLSFFQKNENCVQSLLHRVFSTVLELSASLSLRNCFVLKKMANSYEHTVTEVKTMIFNFMLKHFPAVTSSIEFVSMEKKDALELLQSPDSLYFSSEKIKWGAVTRWMNANTDTKGSTFKTFLRAINLSKLPNEFLQNCLRDEPLLQTYPECRKVLTEACLSSVVRQENFVALLYDNNSIDVFEMNEKKWHPIHYTAKTDQVNIASVNGNLCLLDGKELSFAKNETWVKVKAMSVCPNNASKILSAGDDVYVVDGESFASYSCLSDTWSSFQYLFNYANLKSGVVVTSCSKLYFISRSDKVKSEIFEAIVMPASVNIKLNDKTTAIYFNGKIYVCGMTDGLFTGMTVAYYSLNEKKWQNVSTPSMSQNAKLCVVGENLAVFRSIPGPKVEMEMYNEKWDQWMVLPNMPTFRSCGNSKHIITVCSFCVDT